MNLRDSAKIPASRPGKNLSLWLPALVALAITALWAALRPGEAGAFLETGLIGGQVLKPLARALLFMGLGLTVAMFIEARGLSRRLGRLAAPLTNWARLPRAAAASFTLALVSGPAANGLLSEALERGELRPRALAVANLLNGSWPTFIVHLPSTLAVAAALAGRAGLAYTAVMFAAATLRLFGASALGRLLLPAAPGRPPGPGDEEASKPWPEIWPGLKTRLRRRLLALISVAAPVYYLITLAAHLGFFIWLKEIAALHFPDFFLPAEAAALVIFAFTSEFSSGFAAAGALIENSSLTVPQAAAALVLGNIIATPIRVLRWQLGAYMGFFQVRLGLALITLNQLFRVLSLILALAAFWFLTNA
jgi:hypothetical protein